MATLCAGTPKIIVRDNRGLDVRTLRYNRGVAGDVAAQYVDAQTHNDRGQPGSSQDPRFFGGATLNFQYTPALSGQVLKTVSVDAGTSKACTNIAGQPIWRYSQGRDANLPSDKNITVQLSYDALGRPVQRACYTADVSGGGSLGGPTDIWSYGDYSGSPGATYDSSDTTDARNANQRGQVLQHFDTAGLIDMSVLGYAVQGTVLREDRRFMATACDVNTHWQPGSPQALYGLNKQRLELDTDPANLYSTQWTYSALGQIQTQVDAKGHQRHTAYDCAGRKYTASVTPKGGTLTPVCVGITYTAAGAIDTRSDANNIQVAYVYEPQTTQRLISLTATRVSTQLHALAYAYDGVGNVITLSDSSASAQVSFFRNRAVTPDRGYTYDALYQLTSATGRENYVNNTPKGIDWPGTQFNPTNTLDYQVYTRSYTYDPSGNLTTIRSSNWSAAAPPTRQFVVDKYSNRAVCTANNAGPTQANIDTYFDLAGKNICLDANRNQPMYWTPFHQLYCVVTTYRPGTSGTDTADWSNSDREQYVYDGSGQRIRKYASSMANGNWNYVDTRYLPGLELRGNTATGEKLEVMVLDDGARVLNWAGSAGKPSNIPNLQLRYQYADRQHSCLIETDKDGNVITHEEYYPYGGTAVLASRTDSEVKYKYIRYSGKERDATGLYYYGLRYYQPWIGRWINPDPAGAVDGQNLYCMVRNNPASMTDAMGLSGRRPGGEPHESEYSSSDDEELLELASVSDSSYSMPGPSTASPSTSRLSVPSLSSTACPPRPPSSSRDGSGEASARSLNPADQLRIDAWNRVARTIRSNPSIVGVLATEDNGRMMFNRTPELQEQVRDLHSRNSIGSIADDGETRQAKDHNILKIVGGAGALVLELQRKNQIAIGEVRAEMKGVTDEITRLKAEINNHWKQGSSFSVEDLREQKKIQSQKLSELSNIKEKLQDEAASHGEVFSTPFNRKYDTDNLDQRHAFLANFSEAFQTAASTANRKGLAFASFGTGKQFYFLGITLNIPKNPKDMATYANKAVKDAQGKVVFYEKFKTEELDAHFSALDKLLADYGYSSLHPYTRHKITEFNLADTVPADMKEQEVFHAPRQLPSLAGIPGTHAESILFNELVHNFFPVDQNAGFDQIQKEFASLLSTDLRIFTLRLIKPKANGYPVFSPCVACQAIIGSAINVRNGQESANAQYVDDFITEMEGLGILEDKERIKALLDSRR